MNLSDPRVSWALQAMGEAAPAFDAVIYRKEHLSSSEFVDVADAVISVLAAYLYDEDSPPVGVFCLDASFTEQVTKAALAAGESSQ
tara:strand:+ start:441 stop:698 length:258 start_codon:yes stop_codon:yes gene_type:complete